MAYCVIDMESQFRDLGKIGKALAKRVTCSISRVESVSHNAAAYANNEERTCCCKYT